MWKPILGYSIWIELCNLLEISNECYHVIISKKNVHVMENKLTSCVLVG
jgi:hypothetical protein